MAITPDGRFAYVTRSQGSDAGAIAQFVRGAGGRMEPNGVSEHEQRSARHPRQPAGHARLLRARDPRRAAVAADRRRRQARRRDDRRPRLLSAPRFLAMTPSGTSLYVADAGVRTPPRLLQFDVDPATGADTRRPGVRAVAYGSRCRRPADAGRMAVSPAGRHLYATARPAAAASPTSRSTRAARSAAARSPGSFGDLNGRRRHAVRPRRGVRLGADEQRHAGSHRPVRDRPRRRVVALSRRPRRTRSRRARATPPRAPTAARSTSARTATSASGPSRPTATMSRARQPCERDRRGRERRRRARAVAGAGRIVHGRAAAGGRAVDVRRERLERSRRHGRPLRLGLRRRHVAPPTGGPATEPRLHAPAAPPTVKLTVTDADGTSTAQLWTGSRMLRNGGPSAQTTRTSRSRPPRRASDAGPRQGQVGHDRRDERQGEGEAARQQGLRRRLDADRDPARLADRRAQGQRPHHRRGQQDEAQDADRRSSTTGSSSSRRPRASSRSSSRRSSAARSRAARRRRRAAAASRVRRASRRRGSSPRAAKAKKKRSKRSVRRLWGHGKGDFKTVGRRSSATVRGTWWLVEDRCDGTLTRVKEGRVDVRDVRLKKTIKLRAGKRSLYLAKAP